MALILIIDDNPDVTFVVGSMLRFEGYEVAVAESGEAGLAQMKVRQADLILCDIMMPEMDGFQVFQHVRADRRWRSVPFAFLTALGDPETRISSSEIGVEAFIAKPFTKQGLMAVVNGLLRRAAELRSYAADETESLKGQLLFMITHELNTPISVIRMMTDGMRRSLLRRELGQASEYLDLLSASTNELSYIVESMLLALQIDSGRAQQLFDVWSVPHTLRALADHARARAALQISQREILMRVQGDLDLWINGHEEQLRQVFARVVDNAVKFSPKGGTVDVIAEGDGDWVRVSIVDRGPGMAEDQLERAFARLSQINRDQQEQPGVGLSLNLVRSLLEIHGGSIVIETVPGEGTTVVISLPQVAAPEK